MSATTQTVVTDCPFALLLFGLTEWMVGNPKTITADNDFFRVANDPFPMTKQAEAGRM